ncbi:MAG TPA: hypothetical protein VGL88_10935 [Pseudonocardiaceae bacterium]|jgi:type II secretory pathway pseudopilin PulG
MTSGAIVVVASVLVILGVLIGFSLSKWQRRVQVRRQAAAQISLYRQLHELQEARRSKHKTLAGTGQRQAA